MKKIYVGVRFALLAAAILPIFSTGCSRSNVPVPEKPIAYTQEKVQAAGHWRDIAVDISEKIRDALVERTDLTLKPVYVAIPDGGSFMISFHQLLLSELVSRAIQVSETREPDAVLVEYDVITVRHDPSRFSGGIYSHLADLGVGISRLFTGPSGSDNEIIVNVRMAYDNRYVVHRSYVRYINDAEWKLYFSPGSFGSASGTTRPIRVINR